MKKIDERILSHLQPYNMDLSDTYFCSICKYNKDDFMETVFEKVSAWVEKNGGKIQKLSGRRTIGDRKGYIVRILFPCYGKRDMKNIMATLWLNKSKDQQRDRGISISWISIEQRR